MRDIPVDVLLSWPVPNYTNPETRGSALAIVNYILISFVIIAVFLRLYIRIVVKKWFGSDDFFIIPSLFFTIGLTTVVLLANQRYGWDRHVWDTPIVLFTSSLKIAFVAKLMFTWAATAIRSSLLCFYYRLSHDSAMHWFRWAIHGSMAFNIAICVAYTFLIIFLCTPIHAYWMFPTPPSATCLNEGHATLAAGVINCVADLLITLLPVPIIMKLQMPLRQRVGVAALLSVGLIVTAAGVIRTYFIWKSLMDSYDETWDAYPLWISAAVEIDLGVLCACAPALRPLLRKPFRALSDAINSSRESTGRRVRSLNCSITPKKRSKTDSSRQSIPESFNETRWPSNIKMTTTFELTEREDETAKEIGLGARNQPDIYARTPQARDSREILLRPDQALIGDELDLRLFARSAVVTSDPEGGHRDIP